jgi:methionyl-tRNA formyltransferase
MQPWPGAYTVFRGQTLRLWRTRMAAPEGPRRRLLARCGDGAELELLDVQLEGKKRMAGDAFANGQRITEEGGLRFV